MTAPTAVAATVLLLAGVTVAVADDARQQLPQGVVRVYSDKAPGITAPAVVESPRPMYTTRAMRDRIEGTVTMDLTVGSDGHVRDVLLAESLDEDLDRSAIEAASQWFFRPGTLEGMPVPVRVEVTMSFSMH